MILIQTLALLKDAYRDLNSRKLFWVVLIINALVILGFSALGVSGNHLMLLNWQIPLDIPLAMFVYKWIFTYIILGQWLTWAATLLALISTASIFPDFMAGGAIDLYLSKPIGRLRLFATKYLTGLLFVLVQVAIFAVGGFLVLGLRAGTWEPGLFWAVPLVVLFFSYLFAICVFFGVLTRSGMAAFFLTLIAWILIFSVNQADRFLMQADDIYQSRAAAAQKRVARLDQQIADLQARLNSATRPATAPSALASPAVGQLTRLQLQRNREQLSADQQRPPEWVQTAQPILFALNTLVPKTQDTLGLLDRSLFSDMVIKNVLDVAPDRGPMRGWRRQMYNLLHARSPLWILGSSIAFELVILALAARRFCRRDF